MIGLVLLIWEHYMFMDFLSDLNRSNRCEWFSNKSFNNISSKVLDLKDYFNTYSDSLENQSGYSFLFNFWTICNLHFWKGTYKRRLKTWFQFLFGLHSQRLEVMGSRLKRLKVVRNRLLVRPIPHKRHCNHIGKSQNNQRISHNIQQRNTLSSTNWWLEPFLMT